MDREMDEQEELQFNQTAVVGTLEDSLYRHSGNNINETNTNPQQTPPQTQSEPTPPQSEPTPPQSEPTPPQSEPTPTQSEQTPPQREEEIIVMDEWLRNRRSTTRSQHWSADSMIRPEDSASQVGARPPSRLSSVGTRISSARLREEEKQIEIHEKMQALKRRRELELAKLNVKLEEEEFELQMEMNIVKAKQKNFDKYETQIKFNANGSYINERNNLNNNTEQELQENNFENTERVPLFYPPPIAVNPVFNDTSISERRQTDISGNGNGVNVGRGDSGNNNDQIIASVVRQLRKPVPNITKFSGDPLAFRKFMRQFNTKIVANSEGTDECFNYLEQFTEGEAYRIVNSWSSLEASIGYPAALAELERRYGNDEILANAFVKRALDWPIIKGDNPKALDDFAIFLTECENAIKTIDAVKVLEYPDNLKRLLGKLPYFFHDKWRNIVQNNKSKFRSSGLHDFARFVRLEAEKACDPTYGRDAIRTIVEQKGGHVKPPSTKQFNRSSFATTVDENKMSEITRNWKDVTKDSRTLKNCIFCNLKSHSLNECYTFQKHPHSERIEFLKGKGICFGCLQYGHMSKTCKVRETCSTCKGRHPTVLHDEDFVQRRNEFSQKPPVQLLSNSACNLTGAGEGECTMAVVPVQVRIKNSLRSVKTYAFLDPGSTVTFCSEKLMSEIGGIGKRQTITLDTMGVQHKFKTLVVNGLQVGNLDFENVIDLPRVFTKDRIPIGRSHIPTNKDVCDWHHLNDLQLPELDCEIGLLIGNNIPDAYTPIDVRTGPRGSPHATRSMLGWIVWNLVRPEDLSNQVNSILSVNRAEITAIQETEELRQLDKLVRDSMNVEFPERTIDDKRENSVEDKIFLDSVNKSIHMENGHYTIGLPFRTDNVKLPDNTMVALKRLDNLKRKLINNTVFQKDYIQFMNQILDKGYAEKVSPENIDGNPGQVWYIPHHGVYHPRKPDKLRVVFDCSASYLGASLNNVLLQGPDMTNGLLGVLLRFRQEPIAIMGDIEAMFYQVHVPKTDRDFLRFFWWPDGDFSLPPQVYRMTVHIFGATSSPSCSSFALRRTAQDNSSNFDKKISEGIHRNFYVDDYLTSTRSEEEAGRLIQDTTAMCREGGFHLTKWMCNRQPVLESVDSDNRCKGVKMLDLKQDPLPPERALGVYWITNTDSFGFEIGTRSVPRTRRGILSLTSSIYDPLGILSPYILIAKGILQDLCRLGAGWDDEVQGIHLKKWDQWLRDLTLLKELSIDRCYKPFGFSRVVSIELHNFSDASDTGYGMVSYLRLTDDKGHVHCSFVLGKSRVLPLKKITIPRLELAAATALVKLSKLILTELDYTIEKVYFWTDSMSVLRYIANKTSRFHTFVANRLAIIQEATDVEQWRFVDTKSNPADPASRGLPMAKLLQCKAWFHGPDFLWAPSSEWPQQDTISDIQKDDIEVKRQVNVSVATFPATTEQFFSHYSDFRKLKRAVGWILVAIDNLKGWVSERRNLELEINASQYEPEFRKQKLDAELMKLRHRRLRDGNSAYKSTLNVEKLQKAETAMVRYVQGVHFQTEIDILRLGQDNRIPKSSGLIKLDPFICDGILRVGGRLHKADIPFEARHPAVLPKSSHLTNLILQDAHRSLGHLGKNSILAQTRQRYWILGVGTVIKSLLAKCVRCKRYQAPLQVQKMASLPVDRLTAEEPPFNRTGMDFFGPFEIKRGRSVVKRYGVIFTCLAVRAVHLEVAASLDTDSCIHAIRRFVARRGPVKLILSDNGTNIVGAEREMREDIQQWNLQKIENACSQQNIEWKFNPPSASHFGGVWERLIRLVRKILYSLMHSQTIRLDDESLHTLFCEAEAIINGRPLTEIPGNTKELEVLTPNHLLLLRGGECLPPGLFDKHDVYPRKRWRQVQYLANLFWARWRREYLPLLQTRQKWNNKNRNLNVDDIVLVVDNSPRNSWSLARVIEVYMDSKGFVRSVKLKTKSTTLVRPIAKLCLILESDE